MIRIFNFLLAPSVDQLVVTLAGEL